jgi:uncharacterized membrane protein
MSWATRFRIRQRLKGSLWVVPLLGVLMGVLLGFLDVRVEGSIHLPSNWTYSSSTASTVLSAIVGAMAALTGFVVTVTVLVAQMAIGTFSARFMRLWYRDPLLKAVLAVFMGTLAFGFSLLRRVTDSFVPNLGVSVAGVLVLVSLLLFVVFLDSYLHKLRPVAVASLGAGYVRREFKRLVAALDAPDVFAGPATVVDGGDPTWMVRNTAAGSIQAIDLDGLASWGRKRGCLLVLEHRIGDFVPTGARLISAYGGPPGTPRDEQTLHGMVALGNERTVEQDPAFAIRVVVDVAVKALSAAINDPTTAVQVLDQLSEVLRVVGTTDLERDRLQAGDGHARGVVVPMRSWEEYLALGVTEIREYGASSIQVVRRMRAMLEQLQREVPPEHRRAVTEELARLDATVASAFAQSIDLDRARIADEEGMGGRVEPATEYAATH